MKHHAFLPIACALALSTTAGAPATTASKSIPVSVQIVGGNSVSAYLIRGNISTVVRSDARASGLPAGALPIVRVDFDLQHSWTLVKRVTWDKARNSLTIDF